MDAASPDPNLAPDPEALAQAVDRLRGARRWLVVTGAGLSADSGLPTYRGIGGLYEERDPEEGIPIDVALSGQMLARRPDLTWKYLRQIGDAVFGAEPNEGHHAIARLEERFEVTVLTQNVDGFHRAAGSTDVVDIHGDCHELRCDGCGARWRVDDYQGLAIPPACAECEGEARPDVVLFGEMLPPAKVAKLQAGLVRGYDAYLSVGTSSLFPYISGPILMAAAAGKPTIEVNPGETPVSDSVDVHLRCGAAATLVALEAALR